MWQPSPSGPTAGSPASSGRRALTHLGTIAAVVLVAITGATFTAYQGLQDQDSTANTIWCVVGLFGALGLGLSMIWRRRYPGQVLVANAATALLLPIDPLGTLIALSWVLPTASPRRAAQVTALAALVTGVTLMRDAARDVPAVIFASVASDVRNGSVMTWWGYLLVGLVAVAAAFTAGWVRRLTAATARARAVASIQTSSALALRGELNRQEERELIAREMHDTVAHHLSIVSLHAAALEVTTTDPTVPESARAVRDSAHRALEEMRGLITSLRDSQAEGYTGGTPTLRDLPRLVADARAAGVAIAETFEVDAVDPPLAVTRAVYRIVQEALTNALKHAPGAGVRLAVRATECYGVEIVVASWLPVGRPAVPAVVARHGHGAGAGIVGMRERAWALGGDLWAGADGQLWVVRAQLPWHVGGAR